MPRKLKPKMCNNNYYILIYLEAAGDPGHEGETEEDGQQEEEEEVEPHVGRGVRLQGDHAVLAPGKRGAQVLNSGVITLCYSTDRNKRLTSILCFSQNN